MPPPPYPPGTAHCPTLPTYCNAGFSIGPLAILFYIHDTKLIVQFTRNHLGQFECLKISSTNLMFFNNLVQINVKNPPFLFSANSMPKKL